jgi:hypothetical protein
MGLCFSTQAAISAAGDQVIVINRPSLVGSGQLPNHGQDFAI